MRILVLPRGEMRRFLVRFRFFGVSIRVSSEWEKVAEALHFLQKNSGVYVGLVK